MDLLAVQGTLKSLLQHRSSKTSILRCSDFFMVQLSHPYLTTGKTIALSRLGLDQGTKYWDFLRTFSFSETAAFLFVEVADDMGNGGFPWWLRW